MNLYIKQRVFSIGDKYEVFDENQTPVYFIKGEVFSFGAKIHLMDTTGNELYYIQQKLFRFLPEYHIFQGEREVAIIKKEFTFIQPKLNISSEYGQFSIEGEIFSMDFVINKDQQPIGELHKKWFTFGDSYELSIVQGTDFAFFCALVVAIDNCLHNENKN